MLRLLHTSDWHLGQLLREQDRAFEHEQFLNWLRGVIREREIDVLLLAGDVFDVANPPAAAQRQFYNFIAAARADRPSLQIVIIAGNHDSPSRLEAPNALVQALGVSVIGRVPWQHDSAGEAVEPALDAMLIPLWTQAGTVEAFCLAVPFLRPGDVPPVESESDAYALGIALLYRELVACAERNRRPGQAIVAMGHAAVLPASRRGAIDPTSNALQQAAPVVDFTDEEEENEAIRPIVLGGLERLDERMFPDVLAYVALGHLHRAGRVGHREQVRYSGSPLPLSFAERGYRHQVVYVELDGERATRIESIEIPRVVAMLRMPSEAATLEQVVTCLKAWTPTGDQQAHPVWLEVALAQTEVPVFDLVAQIDAALKDKPVRAWRLIERIRAKSVPQDSPAMRVSSLDEVQRMLEPEQLLTLAWRRMHGERALPEQLLQCLREVMSTPGES